jgi:hypothetical protein
MIHQSSIRGLCQSTGVLRPALIIAALVFCRVLVMLGFVCLDESSYCGDLFRVVSRFDRADGLMSTRFEQLLEPLFIASQVIFFGRLGSHRSPLHSDHYVV